MSNYDDLLDLSDAELLKAWDDGASRTTWTTVLERARTEADSHTARRVLDTLPEPLPTLAANARLVRNLVGCRWYVVLAALERGADWDQVAAALRTTRDEAIAAYRAAVEKQEHYGLLRDSARARAVLPPEEEDDTTSPAAEIAADLGRRPDVLRTEVVSPGSLRVEVRPESLDTWRWWLNHLAVPVGTATSRGNAATATGQIGSVVVRITAHGVGKLANTALKAAATHREDEAPASLLSERARRALRVVTLELIERPSPSCDSLSQAIEILDEQQLLASEDVGSEVFRVEFDAGMPYSAVPMGTYDSLELAQARCLTQMSREFPRAAAESVYRWVPDDEDDPCRWELHATRGEAREQSTHYAVALVTVHHSSDEEDA